MLVNAVWQRMTDIFGSAWHRDQGPRLNPKNQNEYTGRFLTWCKKLEHLTDDEFACAFKHIEWKVRESARLGEKDVYAPSYPAFIGFAKIENRSRDEGGANYYFRPETTLPDKTAEERNKKIGMRTLSNLKDLINQKEPDNGQPKPKQQAAAD